MSQVTELLRKCKDGVAGAKDELYELLYSDLTRMARGELYRAGPMTLDPAALVNDLWLRCSGEAVAENRVQFMAYASKAMRSVIIDYVRAYAAGKRDKAKEVRLTTVAFEELSAEPGVLGIHDALTALEGIDARCHAVVEMRYFAGMTLEEIADALTISVATAKRDWVRARAFLYELLTP